LKKEELLMQDVMEKSKKSQMGVVSINNFKGHDIDMNNICYNILIPEGGRYEEAIFTSSGASFHFFILFMGSY
jgi:hypothetical protein